MSFTIMSVALAFSSLFEKLYLEFVPIVDPVQVIVLPSFLYPVEVSALQLVPDTVINI